MAQVEETHQLRDQIDELRHVEEKLQKSQILIDKYRQRSDDESQLKKTIKVYDLILKTADLQLYRRLKNS